MDNRTIAQLLDETADLLEISAADPFRIRSYRRAAEAVESSTVQLSEIADDPKKLLAIPGIGKGMAANIRDMHTTGTLPLREELLAKVPSHNARPAETARNGPKVGRSHVGSATNRID